MVNKNAYKIFLHKVKVTGDCPIRTFFYDWFEYEEEMDRLGLYKVHMEADFKLRGFGTHALGNK